MAIAGIRSGKRTQVRPRAADSALVSPPIPLNDLPRLQSARLILRTLTGGDAPAVYQVIDHSRALFTTWFTWAHDTTLTNVRQNLEEANLSMMAGNEWHYGIFERVDASDGTIREGKFLGRIGLSEIDQRARTAELGYWLDVDAQGRGLMTEAVQLMLGLALADGRGMRIEAYTDVDNVASQHVLLKCGFQQTGRISRAVKHPLRGWRDQFGFVLVGKSPGG